MQQVLTHINQVSPEWLTACLRAKGVLPQGRVLSVMHQAASGEEKTQGTMAVQYSADAPASAPAKFFLKMGAGDASEDDDMEKEVYFYQHFAEDTAVYTVHCHDTSYATDPAHFHLLLTDMSDTHNHTSWPLPPTPTQMGMAVDTLAGIHAQWWNHPNLQTMQRREYQTELVPGTWLGIWERQLTQYLDFLGDRLSAPRRATYEWVLPRLIPLLHQRLQGREHFTLIHQDAHHYNFLFPRNPETDVARLVDWATWNIGPGGCDLAYLIALFFFPEQRAYLEQPLLRRYYDRLLLLGVSGYSWDALWDDYRLYVIYNLFIPVEQFVFDVPAHVWWLHAERAFLAYEDLNCVELLS